ncbi:DUF4105 domain-containing protein [Candidatus Halobeggiatoa sp. HSG11]|nr:DUF4105 domain-containing protein [Candidatus Halobeggiatoa sp. HSG11]
MRFKLVLFLSYVAIIPNLYAMDWSYLQHLQQQAQPLADHRDWHILLHYQLTSNGFISEVDDLKFFNAKTGKTDPQAELTATLQAFFTPKLPNQQHPQCRFIARYQWLKQQLNFDDQKLPPQPCPKFDDWLKRLQPAGLTLIFPAAFLNGPSSAFGHTLLRIDQVGQTPATKILAQALNYAAKTDGSSHFLYAIKGIFGGYSGQFSMLPYYKKVTEYGDMENRDIWEYQLDFSIAEIQRMLRHIWELDKMEFDYFFFDENCSYHLLSLLEAARPSLKLLDKLWAWVIPGETVRIVDEAGLVKKKTFRPASTTKLQHQLRLLSTEQRNWIRQMPTVELDELKTMDTVQQAEVLETAYDYLYHQHKSMNNRQYAPILRKLLVARSALPTTDMEPPPVPVSPEQGHAIFRLGMGLGYDGERGYRSLNLRPAYHDLLDPKAGYTAGNQINFLNLTLRNYEQKLELNELQLVDILSLAPYDSFFKPWSWKLSTGWKRRYFGERDLVYYLNGGRGISYKFTDNSLIYGFLEADLNIDGNWQHAVGLGSDVGLFVDISSNWRMLLKASNLRFALGEQRTVSTYSLEQRFTVNKNNAINLQFQYHDNEDSQLVLNWYWYF